MGLDNGSRHLFLQSPAAWFRNVLTVWCCDGPRERADGLWCMLEFPTPQHSEVTMPFRLEHITLAERVDLGCTCLLNGGQYGLITDLARAYGTSRQFLYTLREKALTALEVALAPGLPGRPLL